MNEEYPARVRAVCGEDQAIADLYVEICGEVERVHGKPPSAAAIVQILDYVRLEQLKDRANEDIAQRGLGRMETNGRQRYWKDNKSAVLILKYMEQQRKILKGLGIGGADPMTEQDDSDVDDFDSI